MKTLIEVFEGRKIRALCDRDDGKLWFSAVDVCAAVLGCGHAKARNYWKKLNWSDRELHPQPVTISNQLNFSAPDGKHRYTDTLDFAGVMSLILTFPGKKANPLRLWLAQLLAAHPQVIGQLTDIAKASGYKQGKTQHILQTKVVTEIVRVASFNDSK